jgi:HlyD family secretion protein
MTTKTNAVQAQQTKRQFATAQEYLSYELGMARKSPPPLYTRLIAGGICVLVGSAIAWAALSRVDEVATATGQVIPSAQVQPMRALASGLLRDIKVTEGKQVRKGEVLVQLDPTISQAEVERLEKLARLNRSDLARLEAERKGSTQVGTELQNQLLASRLQEFRDRRAAAEAEATRQQSLITTAQVQKARLESDLVYANTKLQGLETLKLEGAIPRFDYLDAQNRVAALQKEIAAQEQAIRQAEQAYQAAQKNAQRLASERRSEILTQIDKQHQELTDLEGKLSQAREQRNQNTIRAAVNGTVYNVQVMKAGASVQPGQELLSIVPDGEELVLDTKVSNQDIGFVRSGMRAKVKLATFPYQEFGMIEGTVVSISPNSISEKDGNLVFPTRIKLQKHSVRVKGQDIKLTPGMSASAEIVTRQKTILSFLLDPITASWDKAFSIR